MTEGPGMVLERARYAVAIIDTHLPKQGGVQPWEGAVDHIQCRKCMPFIVNNLWNWPTLLRGDLFNAAV
eukprot:962160-Pelagomonas_calceolata.AAC.2